MKPHMEYIQKTLTKKKQASIIEDPHGDAYQKYMRIVEKAKEDDYPLEAIIGVMLMEKIRIINDVRGGTDDKLYNQSVENTKKSCLNAIDLIISELKKEK